LSEEASLTGREVEYQRLPIPDFSTPTPEKMAAILDTIDTVLAAGHTIYVHCWGGIGRTGTVVGCYLVRHSLSGTEALAEIAHLRRGIPDEARMSPETEAQQRMVLTWANVSAIFEKGADWYAAYGTEKSRGTKTFSLVGKINRTGLIEVPMGISLQEIIHGIGGGIPQDKTFKAVQTGGPSGGCLPAIFLDSPVDYESLAAAGSIVGSGGMVVMDEDDCMVDVARYFLTFTQLESCGKCIPCRWGTKQMLDILEDIVSGKGREGDIELLLELGETVKAGSLCALGGTAPNPVLTTIRYFRDEYEAHVNEKCCPALSCKALVDYWIDAEKCTACGRCLKACPADAITGEKRMAHVIDQDRCTKCGSCLAACPPRTSAVIKSSGRPIEAPPEPVPVVARTRSRDRDASADRDVPVDRAEDDGGDE
jgi:NAD-dependent dihydropyrimidine dehydrogenase PreA subunit